MKKQLALCVVLSLMIFRLSGQDTLQIKKHRNELGLDFTPFLKFYSNFSQNNIDYQPIYYLTYRYHFPHGNIRAAIGGMSITSDSPSTDPNILPLTFKSRSYSVNVRIGYEFFQELSKRWQVFYGLDFRPGYEYRKEDNQFSNGGYSNGYEGKTNYYAIAPVLGLRFRITKRMSLLTESSLQYTISKASTRRYYIPLNAGIPARADDPLQKNTATSTNFNLPLSLILTIDL